MAEKRISFRELELLTGFGKNVLCRLAHGEFRRLDPQLQRKIKEVTADAVGHEAWTAFLERRLSENREAA